MATETHSATGNGMADVMGVDGHDMATSSTGMPQLDFSTWANQIFWLLVALIVIYLVLSRVALPRIAAVLAERQGTISNDIARAEAESAVAAIRASAMENVEAVAKDTAEALVAALGGSADTAVISDAVDNRMKG